MERPWLAYLVVALLSVGAGAAIAGPPNNAPTDATIIAPSATIAPATSDAATDSEPDAVESAGTTVSETPTSTTTTSAPPASSATSTTTTSTTTTSTLPADDLAPRGELVTIVANGANISGAAGRNVERLQALGYTDIAPRNGTTVFDLTTVYFADGLDAEASRLADDLELLPNLIAPLDEAPNVLELPEGVDLVAYIGLDRPG